MYSKTTWIDRAVQYVRRYLLTLVSGTTYDLTPQEGTVTQAGTAVTAARMNNIENGVEGAAKGTIFYAASSAGNDSYVLTFSPALTAYVTGLRINFKADVANTGAATLNVNELGAKTIKKNVTDDLSDNDIKVNQIITVVYDGTNFQLISNVPAKDWTQIATTTLGSDAASITFTSIPTAYNYLKIIIENAKTSTATGNLYLYLQFNDDSGSNYTWQYDLSNGHSRNSSDTKIRLADYGLSRTDITSDGNDFIFEIDQSNISRNKKLRGYCFASCGSTSAVQEHQTIGGVWRNTANKITKMYFYPFADNLKAGTKITIYGMV